MPSIAERNAAFDAVKKQINAMEQEMPGMYVGYVEEYVTTARILGFVNAALTAAEQARATPAPATAKK